MTQDFQHAIAPGRISVQSEQADGSRRYVLQVPRRASRSRRPALRI